MKVYSSIRVYSTTPNPEVLYTTCVGLDIVPLFTSTSYVYLLDPLVYSPSSSFFSTLVLDYGVLPQESVIRSRKVKMGNLGLGLSLLHSGILHIQGRGLRVSPQTITRKNFTGLFETGKDPHLFPVLVYFWCRRCLRQGHPNVDKGKED